MSDAFDLICEIEPPTKPDLRHVRHQIGTLAMVAHSFLIPDNHIGRATVSSIAVAHEVAAMGGRSIACLNSRDRNLLGFQRDMLTAAAYGVDHFLFVHGDDPTVGGRTSQLTVRSMMEEARAYSDFRVGVAAGLRRMPGWKRQADFVFLQVGFDAQAQIRWREEARLEVPVYAGVMVLASEKMARMLAQSIPDIGIPEDLIAAVAADRSAGVEAACEQIQQLKESGAFNGVHLVTVSRYREMALRLEGRR